MSGRNMQYLRKKGAVLWLPLLLSGLFFATAAAKEDGRWSLVAFGSILVFLVVLVCVLDAYHYLRERRNKGE
jgi:hypothetical protein